MNLRIAVLLAAGLCLHRWRPMPASFAHERVGRRSVLDRAERHRRRDVDGHVGVGRRLALLAPMPQYSGVVPLIMDYGAGGAFICSGTLLPDRRSILTAAHCVSDGAGSAGPLSTTAYFYGVARTRTLSSR